MVTGRLDKNGFALNKSLYGEATRLVGFFTYTSKTDKITRYVFYPFYSMDYFGCAYVHKFYAAQYAQYEETNDACI